MAGHRNRLGSVGWIGCRTALSSCLHAWGHEKQEQMKDRSQIINNNRSNKIGSMLQGVEASSRSMHENLVISPLHRH